MRKILGATLLAAIAAAAPVHAGPIAVRNDVTRQMSGNWFTEQYGDAFYKYTNFSISVDQQNGVTSAALWKYVENCTIDGENWNCTDKSFQGDLVGDPTSFSFDDQNLGDASIEGAFAMQRIDYDGTPIGKVTTVNILAIWNGTDSQERHKGERVNHDNSAIVVHEYDHGDRQAVAGLTVNGKTVKSEGYGWMTYDKKQGIDNQS